MNKPIKKILKWITAFLKALVDTTLNALILIVFFLVAKQQIGSVITMTSDKFMLILQWVFVPINVLFYTLRNYKQIR